MKREDEGVVIGVGRKREVKGGLGRRNGRGGDEMARKVDGEMVFKGEWERKKGRRESMNRREGK